MEGAPLPSEGEPEIEISDDNRDLFDKRFVFKRGLELPEGKKKSSALTNPRKPRSSSNARARWEALGKAHDERRRGGSTG